MALVSLSISADSLSRFGRAGWRCDLDVMELIVFIADAAAALYFLFGVGVDDAPHLVDNIVSLWHRLLDAFDIAEADEDDATATTHCRERSSSSDLRWCRAATIVSACNTTLSKVSGTTAVNNNFHFWFSVIFGIFWLSLCWGYPLYENYRNSWNLYTLVHVSGSLWSHSDRPSVKNCAENFDARSHKNGPSANKGSRESFTEGWRPFPWALACTVQLK